MQTPSKENPMCDSSRPPRGKYAGIGSRKTPGPTLAIMERMATCLAGMGWTLRSGGARGADQAFISGAGQEADVFLPWPGYEGFEEARLDRPTRAAYELAARFHPTWAACRRGPRALHARNSHQILGPNLNDAVSFVVCWTPDASLHGATRASGGTGQALRIAAAYSVPVFNLADPEHRTRIERFIG
jgi:hypothetical protein